MTNNTEYDEDGDVITLSDADKLEIEDEIAQLDAELEGYRGGSDVWRELNRQRRHLVAELEAGRRLPLLDDDEEE